MNSTQLRCLDNIKSLLRILGNWSKQSRKPCGNGIREQKEMHLLNNAYIEDLHRKYVTINTRNKNFKSLKWCQKHEAISKALICIHIKNRNILIISDTPCHPMPKHVRCHISDRIKTREWLMIPTLVNENLIAVPLCAVCIFCSPACSDRVFHLGQRNAED